MFGLSYLRLAVYAAVIAAVLGVFLYVKYLQHEVTTLTDLNAGMTRELNAQNEAIRRFKEYSDNRVKAAEEELAKAKAATKAAQQKATVIYRTPPSDPTNTCKSALDIINEQAR